MFGASVRAAAMSAIRAGWRPWCADLFADRDLRQIAPVVQISGEEYPNRFLELLSDGPAGPWLYTGSLENHPRLVNTMAKKRRLLGISGPSLRALRSPVMWSKALRDANMACPKVIEKPPINCDNTRWLQKPKRSSAGHGISLWSGGRVKRGYFLQEFMDGSSHAAVFIGDGKRAHLLGVTRQLVGESWLNAPPFVYCGSIGPIALSPNWRRPLQRIGDCLASAFEVRGLFGVDFVLSGETPYPVEINPRYTASVEILEYAFQQPILRWHRSVFDIVPFQIPSLPAKPQPLFGKAILYAKNSLTFPAKFPLKLQPWSCDDPFTMPEFADIPNANESIETGKPIMTLFARGTSVSDCQRTLREKTQTIDRDFAQLYNTK